MSTEQLPPLPPGWPARMQCDSCGGRGHYGEARYMGEFQPPECAECSDCSGSGSTPEEQAYSASNMESYARAAIAADRARREKPSGTQVMCMTTAHRLAQNHPATDASQAEQAAMWRAHRDKLDALVAYCPTCCEGKVASADMTRDEVIFQCGKTAGRAAAAHTQESRHG